MPLDKIHEDEREAKDRIDSERIEEHVKENLLRKVGALQRLNAEHQREIATAHHRLTERGIAEGGPLWDRIEDLAEKQEREIARLVGAADGARALLAVAGSRLEGALAKERAENERLREESDKHTRLQRIIDAEDDREQLRADLAAVKAENEKLQKCNDGREKIIRSMSRRKDDLRADLAKERAETDTLRKANNGLAACNEWILKGRSEDATGAAPSVYEKPEVFTAEQIVELMETNTALRAELQATKADRDAALMQLEQDTKRLEVEHEDFGALLRALGLFDGALPKSRHAILHDDVLPKIEKLTKGLTRCRESRAIFKGRLDTTEKENRHLLEAIAKAEMRAEKAEAECERLKSEIQLITAPQDAQVTPTKPEAGGGEIDDGSEEEALGGETPSTDGPLPENVASGPSTSLAPEVAELVEALERAVKTCRCRGTGEYETDCSYCGDSTFDHECNDSTRACTRPWCIGARKALSNFKKGTVG
jgi:hypothetical protein